MALYDTGAPLERAIDRTQSAYATKYARERQEALDRQTAISTEQDNMYRQIKLEADAFLKAADYADSRPEEEAPAAFDEMFTRLTGGTATIKPDWTGPEKKFTTANGQVISGSAKKLRQFAWASKNRPDMANDFLNLGQMEGSLRVEKEAPVSDANKESWIDWGFGYKRNTKTGEVVPVETKPQKPLVSVSVNTGKEGMTEIAKQMGKDLVAQRPAIEQAVESLGNLKQARGLLNSGVITGAGAEWLVSAGKAFRRIGFNVYENDIANTEAYAALMGREVGKIIKQFGSGTGLSDADREYAEKIAAGKVTVSEKAIRKLLDMQEKANRTLIKNFNKKAAQVMKKEGAKGLPYDLRVSIPSEENRLSDMSDAELLKALGVD